MWRDGGGAEDRECGGMEEVRRTVNVEGWRRCGGP